MYMCARCRYAPSFQNICCTCTEAVHITVVVFCGLLAAILVFLAAKEICPLPHNKQSKMFDYNTNMLMIRIERQSVLSFSYYMFLKHFIHKLHSTTKWPLLCVQAGSLICIKTLLRTTRRRYRKSSELEKVAFCAAVGRKATW